LRYGAGVKGKIVAALQAGVPVVTTEIGAQGIGLKHGASALIGQTPQEIARHILLLLNDPEQCASLANQGREIIARSFSEKAAERLLSGIFDGLTPPLPTESGIDRADLAQRFCFLPWEYVDIYAGGGAYVCCPSWNFDRPIGNTQDDSFRSIWNSSQAQRVRQGILDGTFSECDAERCFLISGKTLPYRHEIASQPQAQRYQQIIEDRLTVLPWGPSAVKLGYDSSCNLSCPSCRTDLIVAGKTEQRKLQTVFERAIAPLLNDAGVLVISSDGDPFASNHYRWVMGYTADNFPDLKLLLCTNGQLFDERAWADCRLEGRLTRVEVSVDAATPETYAEVRRPGDYVTVLRNLEFLSRLRRSSAISSLEISFVVQNRNFREMAAFVDLGWELGVDSISFTPIDSWHRGMDDEHYRMAKIWDSRHPSYADFVEILADPIFDDPRIKLNGLNRFRNASAAHPSPI
jgi:MoaA/NifB/PqqE/SkfB family radical SAM enzyme